MNYFEIFYTVIKVYLFSMQSVYSNLFCVHSNTSAIIVAVFIVIAISRIYCCIIFSLGALSLGNFARLVKEILTGLKYS